MFNSFWLSLNNKFRRSYIISNEIIVCNWMIFHLVTLIDVDWEKVFIFLIQHKRFIVSIYIVNASSFNSTSFITNDLSLKLSRPFSFKHPYHYSRYEIYLRLYITVRVNVWYDSCIKRFCVNFRYVHWCVYNADDDVRTI